MAAGLEALASAYTAGLHQFNSGVLIIIRISLYQTPIEEYLKCIFFPELDFVSSSFFV